MPLYETLESFRKAMLSVTQDQHPETVVLADDHEIVREGFALILAAAGLRVVAQCPDGVSALEAIERHWPDYAVLDLEMPGMNGIEVIAEVRRRGMASRLVVLSICRDGVRVMEALRAGADAYVLKDGPRKHLLDAMAYVRDGGVYVSPLLGGAAIFAQSEALAKSDPLSVLSPREREVFRLLVNGNRAKEIAAMLDLSPKTIDTYRSNLMRKLGVENMVSLVKFAFDKGVVESGGRRETRRPSPR
ncbi:MAG: response regulator transcription factor [Bryobacteraceae bacterium]|jgi:DNA-binding NarL/FixJ family response regulator